MAASCSLVFAWTITRGSFKLIAPGFFSSYYDFQAVSLLHGRLNVPFNAISGEAFVRDGKAYGYWGPTPALLRIPFALFSKGIGHLTRGYMLGYFGVSLLAAYLLLLAAWRMVPGGTSRPPARIIVAFLGSAGLGSTLFYLGSHPDVYHESLLCGAMFALFACWAALRYRETQATRWWVLSLVCATLSLHARAPAGLFALAFLAGIAGAVMLRPPERKNRAGVRCATGLILVGCGLALGSQCALNYLKFATWEGIPLRLNVQYTPERLAIIEGRSFHAVNVPLAWDVYVMSANFHLASERPYFFVGPKVSRSQYPTARIDYREPTLSVPFAMPGLFFLGVLGGLGLFLFARTRVLLAVTWAAFLPTAFLLLSFIAVTQRYTADFCGFLIVNGAVVLAATRDLGRWLRMLIEGTFFLLTVIAILITVALTIQASG